MTPEGKVKAQVRQLLLSFDAYWHCPVQNGMGAPSLDFIGCYYGRYFAVETKAPGKKPTERQLSTIESIRRVGGVVFVIDGHTEALEHWLKEIRHAEVK